LTCDRRFKIPATHSVKMTEPDKTQAINICSKIRWYPLWHYRTGPF
jgi:hypothetical protein